MPLLAAHVQHGCLNDVTHYIPARVAALIKRDKPSQMLFTRFVNEKGGLRRRFLIRKACPEAPQTQLAAEMEPYAPPELTFTKPGLTRISDELRPHLMTEGFPTISLAGIDADMCVLEVALDIFDMGIVPLISVDGCASTAGRQAHLAGLAVLAPTIGADHLLEVGLNEGRLTALVVAKRPE